MFPAKTQYRAALCYNHTMGNRVIRVSDKEAASEFGSLLARVQDGAEVVIEIGAKPVARILAAREIGNGEPLRGRLLSECIALLAEDSPAKIDGDFANDVRVAVESHNELLQPPSWD